MKPTRKRLSLSPYGMQPDAPTWEAPLDTFTTVRNVIFREAFAERRGADTPVYTGHPASNILALQSLLFNGSTYWIGAGSTGMRAYTTSNSYDITPASYIAGTRASAYSIGLINNFVYLNDAINAPLIWANDYLVPFVVQPTWPVDARCGHMFAFKYHLFACNVSNASGVLTSRVAWSDAAPPGSYPQTWVPAANNEAGDTDLIDTPGPIIASAPIRDTQILYKRGAMYACEYGGEDVFQFRPLFTNMGALTPHGVCNVGGRHVVVTDGDIILTDGVSRQSLAKTRVARYLFNQIDSARYDELFTFYYRARNEVWVCAPITGGGPYCSMALVIPMDAPGRWGMRDISHVACGAQGLINDRVSSPTWDDSPDTWDASSKKWNETAFNNAEETLVLSSTPTTTSTLLSIDANTTEMVSADVTRLDLHFNEPSRVKMIRTIGVRAAPGFGKLYIRVGARNSPSEPLVWFPSEELIEPAQHVDVIAEGRYISVMISADSDRVWQFSGIDFEYELRGYF
jgi:hypothetical protein